MPRSETYVLVAADERSLADERHAKVASGGEGAMQVSMVSERMDCDEAKEDGADARAEEDVRVCICVYTVCVGGKCRTIEAWGWYALRIWCIVSTPVQYLSEWVDGRQSWRMKAEPRDEWTMWCCAKERRGKRQTSNGDSEITRRIDDDESAQVEQEAAHSTQHTQPETQFSVLSG